MSRKTDHCATFIDNRASWVLPPTRLGHRHRLMRPSAKLVAAVLAFFTPLIIVDLPYISQRAVASSLCSQPIVTDVHLRAPGSAINATIDGKTVTIANSALAFWTFDHGREIVYSGTDGAGGFESEGQSLHIYEAQKRTQRKILSEYYMIKNVQEIKTKAGKTALLVVMQNGGLGMSYLAVVAPDRVRYSVQAERV